MKRIDDPSLGINPKLLRKARKRLLKKKLPLRLDDDNSVINLALLFLVEGITLNEVEGVVVEKDNVRR